MKESQSRNLKTILALLVVAAIGIGLLFLPVREWFGHFQTFIEGLGPIGPIIFALTYVVLTVLLIPGSLMTLGAGAIFGLWVGVAVVVIGSNLGALSSFLLARTFMRERVAKWAEGSPKFAALDRAIGREGFKMVLLSRLSPVFPFTLLNYFLGLTAVSGGSYAVANVLGMLPATFLYVYLGSTAGDALSGSTAEAGPFKLALRVVGLLATIAVVTMITRMAKRSMAMVDVESADSGKTEAQ